MRFVSEDDDFGMMHWRLLSREPDKKLAIYVLPVSGLGTYMRTVIDGVWEEPILIKGSLVIEIMTRVPDGGLVDSRDRQMSEPTFKCLNRELVTLELAKRRFMPKGKPAVPGLELFPGALLTQEQRPMVMPAGAAPPADLMKKIAEAQAADESRP